MKYFCRGPRPFGERGGGGLEEEKGAVRYAGRTEQTQHLLGLHHKENLLASIGGNKIGAVPLQAGRKNAHPGGEWRLPRGRRERAPCCGGGTEAFPANLTMKERKKFWGGKKWWGAGWKKIGGS